MRQVDNSIAEWSDLWPVRATRERLKGEERGLQGGRGQGGPGRGTDTSCAHFQSQGKSLAPAQALCKWALLTDSPFGFCERKRGERENRKKRRKQRRCDVKKTKSSTSYWNSDGSESWESRTSRGEERKTWAEGQRGARADSSATPSSRAETCWWEKKQLRGVTTPPPPPLPPPHLLLSLFPTSLTPLPHLLSKSRKKCG